MLKEVREDNKENDAEHMKSVSPTRKFMSANANQGYRDGSIVQFDWLPTVY